MPTSPLRLVLRVLLFIGGIGVVALLIALQANQSGNSVSPSPTPTDFSEETVTEGRLTCLPHKDQRGPVTLECAYGLKTATGDHYALDMSTFASAVFDDLTMDQSLAVTGAITPLAQVVDTSIKKYDIVGVIHVLEVEKKP